jgi:hypothetical protein
LISLESCDPIFQNSEKLQTIRKISEDLIIASKAYSNIKGSLGSLNLSILNPEDIKSFKNLSGNKVSCFQAIREQIDRKASLNLNLKPIPSEL